MAGTWLPRTEGALVTWFVNWVAKLNAHAATFPTILTAGVLTAAGNDLAAMQHLVNISAQTKTKVQDINDYKRQLLYGPGPIGAYPVEPTFPAAPATVVAADIVARMSALAAQLKADSAYTKTIGEDLGIEAVAPDGPEEPFVMVLKAKALPGSQVEVGFNKGSSDGAHIEGSVNDGPWVPLGNDHFPPYLDTRPPAVAGQAEVRKYRGRPLDGDTPVGGWSAIVQVSTIP